MGEITLITHDDPDLRLTHNDGYVCESQIESEGVGFPEARLLVLDDVASGHVPGVGGSGLRQVFRYTIQE